MLCVLFLFAIASRACGLRSTYQEPSYSDQTLPDLDSADRGAAFGEDVTLTVYATQDAFTTVTNKFYNSVPVTITEFRKSTITLPTREVVRTPVDDLIKVSTLQVTRPATETVTDIFSIHKCSTEVSTEFVTVTHLDQNILQKTLTRTTVTTITFRPTIVQTVVSTEREVRTETETITNTIWVDTAATRLVKY